MKRLISFILIAGVMTGCKSTKSVYRYGKGWTTYPNKSAMTGWNYTK